MPYKVIQWSSGNVGKGVIQAVAERADLEMAGLYIYSSDKEGKDAGDIARVKPMGVSATNSIDAIVNTPADIVIHTPLPSLVYGDDKDADLANICRLLASGKNVITTVGYMYPKAHGPEVTDRLEAACREGKSTFHSTGLNPGWMGDVLPLSMSSLSKRIEQIYVQEITNFEFYPSPEVMFDMMGFGKTEEEFEKDIERYRFWLTGLFRENVQMVADGLGVELDEIQEQTERAHAPSDIKAAADTVRQGTVAGQHWEWAGVKNGKKVIVHETVWRMHRDVAPDWPQGDRSVVVKGEPNIRINFDAQWIDQGLLATGMHAVNAIPQVCEAEPGIKTPIDLPSITGRGSVVV